MITHSRMAALMTKISVGQGRRLGRRHTHDEVCFEEQAAAQLQQGVTGQLERLAALRAQGILTEEEFQAQKSVLLSRG